MKVDRSWLEGSSEEVTTELRTREALERLLDQRASEVRERITREKERAQKQPKRIVRIEKMHPISYWSDLLGFKDETIRCWCKAKELSGQWIKNEWRISESAMKEFLERENQRHG